MEGVGFFVQAAVGMLMITAPFDPIKLLFFNKTLETTGQARAAAAAKVALTVACILGGSVLVGRELLEIMGIDLGAFGFVGGLIVASMGFEMLYAGSPSKAQGGDVAKQGPDEDAGLVIPLSMPLIAGPGAITTAIAISSSEQSEWSLLAGLVAVAVVALTCLLSMIYLGGALSGMKRNTTQFLQRIGGLLLATIGVQLAMAGIRAFYDF